ncbi:MAG: His/Gly/Thr/Pro-type tRNA ligase C-terminal domain-containing protein [Thermosediminibacteraceae bacterium]|nr:His/Gly/Thr/Pro-type tRNA ligase C-terminal domain-containing protein [Thermosediminibacteraceae bacterium]
MKISEIFPSTLFNLPAGLNSRGEKFLYQSGILRTGETLTLFDLGVKLFQNLTEFIEDYLILTGFKKIMQKYPTFTDVVKEVTSPKQLPLFFYSFSSGGFHLHMYAIGEKKSYIINNAINYMLERYLRDMVDVGRGNEKLSKAVMIPNAPFKFFYCSSCGYSTTADYPLTYSVNTLLPGEEKPMERVYTPAKRTIKDLCEFLGIKPEEAVKTMIYKAVTEKEEEEYVAVLVPGSRNIDEKKLKVALGVQKVELADLETVERLTGAPHGFAGPCGLKGIKIVADTEISRMKNFVAGANVKDYHLINVNPGRDFEIDLLADIKETVEGDCCPVCGNRITQSEGIIIADWERVIYQSNEIEIGVLYLDNLILAMAEQHCDEQGLIWPEDIAPYKAIVIPINAKDENQINYAMKIYEELNKIMPTALDDRTQSPGVKFKDAELLGFPIRIIIGPKSLEKGVAEIKLRKTEEKVDVELDKVTEKVCEILGLPPKSDVEF